MSNPLGLRNHNRLTQDQIEILRKIAGWDLGFVHDRIRRKRLLPLDRLDRADLECRRYLALKIIFGDGMEMVDDEADVFWHEFIIFTREYEKFCLGICGKFLHHGPFTTQPPVKGARKAFYGRYFRLFGCYRG